MNRLRQWIDLDDIITFLGIAALGVGVAGAVSIWVALIVVGVVLLAAVAWGNR